MPERTSQNEKDFWLRLDNAAKIFPAVKSTELTSVIRVSVELKERVKGRQLRAAIDTLENRFPYYKVKLKAGFFWYYLEYADLPVPVMADRGVPCRAFDKDGLMYRILVRENRISVEFSHILTDGTGTFEFLRTLLYAYFRECNHKIPDDASWHRPEKSAHQEEYEDAYNRYFQKISAPSIKSPGAFHVPFSLRQKPRFDVLLGIIPIKEIIEKARSYEVSLTEYLIAVYLFSLEKVYETLTEREKRKSKKIVRIEVPVNLRKMYPTKTMRNFSLYVMPEIDLRLGWYSFEELVKVVHHQMQLETDKKLINKMLARHVGGEKHPVLRRVPLFLKSIVLSKLYTQGTSKYSGVTTNLGKIDFTPEINDLIERVVFIPPPANKILKINCGIAGFGKKLVLSFGNITRSKELEKHFFQFLTAQGMSVKIEKYQ